MRKFFVSLFLVSLSLQGLAQNQEISQEELDKRNWFHSDFSKTGIYGVGTNSALEFLKSKGLKPKTTIVVGVIDSGVQIDHEDLKNEIWVNPKEKAGNGKDDDNNGYIDDIYGWDFCADANGVDYNEDTYEATRVVVMYKPLFDSGDKYKDVENMKKMPAEYQTYLRARKIWAEKYYSAKNKEGKVDEQAIEIINFLEELKVYSNDIKLTLESIKNLPTNTEEEINNNERLAFLISNNESFSNMTMSEIIEEAKEELGVNQTESPILKYAYNKNYDPTKGKINIKGYGNNEVEGPDALHGTHVAGIIGATRDNGIGMDGVAGGLVKIMSVRAVPDGDERDEDIANAIRYAVDNGAKIINMSFGKAFSPNKELVYEAIKYADSKGVLMFHAAGNDNKDLDWNYNYPSNYKDGEMVSFTKNYITVGASTRYPENLKASFSNFGTIKVDIFAPGTEIYAPIPDQKYRYLQGTSMASPVAAGCAALLWSYFPELTAEQVKEILFETVNISHVKVNVGSEKDPKDFSTLSATGGVIDINKAVRLAYDRYHTSNSKKRR